MVNISKKELKRQVFHMFFGLVIVILLFFNILNKISMLILVAVAVILCLISKKRRIKVIYWFLDKFEREEDLLRFPGKGALSYLISAYLVVLVFPKDIAMASIMILALGDSVSHVIGKFGSTRHPFNDKKYLEGHIAGAIIAFIGAYYILKNPLEAGAGAVIAMIIEGLNIEFNKKKVDDNILIPIVSALVIWLIRLL